MFHFSISCFKMSIAVFSVSKGIFKAGNNRTLFFALMASTPRAMQFLMISAASFSVSIPIIRPLPVTLFTPFAAPSVSKIYALFSYTSDKTFLFHRTLPFKYTVIYCNLFIINRAVVHYVQTTYIQLFPYL